MRKYFLITEKGCRYLLYRVNGLTKAHIEEWFSETPEKVAVAMEEALLKTSEDISKSVQKSGEVFEKLTEPILIDSREIADRIGRQHGELMTKIREYYSVVEIIKKNESPEEYFIRSKYKSRSGAMRNNFLVTEKGFKYLAFWITGLLEQDMEYILKNRKEKEFVQENQATDKLGDITKTETSKVVGKLYVSELEESRKKNEELTEKLIQEREEDMNEIQLLEQREVLGKQFKIYGTVDEPLFLAKDVAEWIEHNKPSEMITNVDEDEKVKIFINPSDSIAGVLQKNTEYWFLTEEGLYEVLMQSRKPIAKEFKKQVKSILKDIRKHGMYATDELLDNPDLLIQVATKLKEEKEKNIFLLSENKQQEKRIKHLEPYANFSKEYLKSEDTVAQLYLTVEKCTIFSRNYG